jgi:hypothetical protein
VLPSDEVVLPSPPADPSPVAGEPSLEEPASPEFVAESSLLHAVTATKGTKTASATSQARRFIRRFVAGFSGSVKPTPLD